MNYSITLDIIGWCLVAATFILLALQWAYFRREQAKCRKYPFFKFRDDVIWSLITNENRRRFSEATFEDDMRAIQEDVENMGYDFWKGIEAEQKNQPLQQRDHPRD